jgi:hypothetical protein
VLSGRGLCDELITRPEESYRLWCVVVCGNLKNEEAMTQVGSQRHSKTIKKKFDLQNTTGMAYLKEWRVLTARYALSPYIKQIRFVMKGCYPHELYPNDQL